MVLWMRHLRTTLKLVDPQVINISVHIAPTFLGLHVVVSTVSVCVLRYPPSHFRSNVRLGPLTTKEMTFLLSIAALRFSRYLPGPFLQLRGRYGVLAFDLTASTLFFERHFLVHLYQHALYWFWFLVSTAFPSNRRRPSSLVMGYDPCRHGASPFVIPFNILDSLLAPPSDIPSRWHA